MDETGRPRRRWPWLAGGFLLEGAALGVLAGVLAHESRREDPLGEVTKYSLRLAWQDVLHRPSLIALMVACVVVYVVGATLVAQPFVHSRRQLLLVVPAAALVSLALLGVLAVVVWIMVATEGEWWDPTDFFAWGDGGGSRRRDRPEDARHQ